MMFLCILTLNMDDGQLIQCKADLFHKVIQAMLQWSCLNCEPERDWSSRISIQMEQRIILRHYMRIWDTTDRIWTVSASAHMYSWRNEFLLTLCCFMFWEGICKFVNCLKFHTWFQEYEMKRCGLCFWAWKRWFILFRDVLYFFYSHSFGPTFFNVRFISY